MSLLLFAPPQLLEKYILWRPFSVRLVTPDIEGPCGSSEVDALSYKPEGRGFETRGGE
jgi:hypothetical protein